MPAVDYYYDALNRLRRNKPVLVKKGSAINKDTVALEAGRKRGSIRNRPEFSQLIADIEKASSSNGGLKQSSVSRYKRNAENLKSKLDKSVNDKDVAQSRYMSLLYQNYFLKKQLRDHKVEPNSFGEVIDIEVGSIED